MALLHNQPTTQCFLCFFFQFIIQLAWHDFDFATLGMHLVLFSLAGQERAWALLSFRKIRACLVGGECWGGLCELGLMGKRVVCFLILLSTLDLQWRGALLPFCALLF